jgi:hypothetical protein
MPNDSERTAGHKLVHDAVLLNLHVENTEISEFGENTHVRMVMREHREDEDDDGILDSCAMGLIFTLAALSFDDARPRGYSGTDFVEGDQWTVADTLDNLRYERGVLRLHAEYVRGRMMKTTVEVHPDGKTVLDTVGRGEVATRWVAKLQGKKMLQLVAGDGEGAGSPN